MRISLMCGPRVITRQITPLFLYLTSILNLLLSHYLIPVTFCGPLSAGFGLPTLVWCVALLDTRQVGERGWVGSDTPSSSPFLCH